MYRFFLQNKSQERPTDEDYLDKQLGQALFYAVALQLKALKENMFPPPLLAIFIAGKNKVLYIIYFLYMYIITF